MTMVRLNAFQQVMRLWDQVHPYNAAQLIQLRGDPDMDAIESAWQSTAIRLGLGRVHVHKSEFSVAPASQIDPAPRPREVNAAQPLEDFLSAQMNLPFQACGDFPFRPFVCRGHGAYHIGVVYQHWVADSISVRALMHEWFCELYGLPRPGVTLNRQPNGGYWHYFGPHRAGWSLYEALLGLLRYRTAFCGVRRFGPETAADPNVRFTIHRMPDGLCKALRAQARRRGLTLNNVFMAAMAEVCDRWGVNPRTAGRDDLALGTIVDLRTLCRYPAALEDVFGMFLGFTTTIVRRRHLRTWPRLTHCISQQSRWHKHNHIAESNFLPMAAGLLEARFMSPQRWAAMYRRRMPMAAGISNVNLNRSWAAAYHPSKLLDYVRVSPLSPMLPMVFTPTTLGIGMSLGFTRQASLVDKDRAGRIVKAFSDRLIGLASNDDQWGQELEE